ncbi:NADH-quinone oxidoreductase subunit A [Naumannella halotolerans]|uniref:NADH-quinone oxidoreductase subunit A n=1 Tax=Naumannella halotolerans TaxID=993414 RepID=A0A4R7JCQ2_9ACTN|nr:NADH-quinone oxidoreductase subunit A [Naumannella halotolerans]TDT34453.1 NADH-quinone oxidoreductase subunit A [Naumannella halotolerans]
MNDPYAPLLVLLVIAAAFVAVSVITSVLVGPQRMNRAKYDSYECGIEPTPQPIGGGRFPVKYYVTAMMFIVFDIEIVFLYPWAVASDQLGTFALVQVVIFIAIVMIAYFYELRRGGLEWD